jgi:hypothetical protein
MMSLLAFLLVALIPVTVISSSSPEPFKLALTSRRNLNAERRGLLGSNVPLGEYFDQTDIEYLCFRWNSKLFYWSIILGGPDRFKVYLISFTMRVKASNSLHKLSVGTPPQNITVTLATSGGFQLVIPGMRSLGLLSLLWGSLAFLTEVACGTCQSPQRYDPSKSSTFKDDKGDTAVLFFGSEFGVNPSGGVWSLFSLNIT